MTQPPPIEIVRGDLLKAYNQLQPGTLLHVDELMNARRKDVQIQKYQFYTPDGQIYYTHNEIPYLAITREANNPLFRHLADGFENGVMTSSYWDDNNSYYQLVVRHNKNYQPDGSEAWNAMRAKDTVTIDLSQLRLQEITPGGHSSHFSLNIDTQKYQTQLNSEERKFVERIYGSGTDLTENMAMLADAHISQTSISVLDPRFVRRYATKTCDNYVFIRDSWLHNFSPNLSQFWALNYQDSNIYTTVTLAGARKENQ